jgi:hypothetical protein
VFYLQLPGHVDGLETDVIAIKAKTDNLPLDTATTLSTIDTVVDDIQAKTDNLPVDTSAVLGTPVVSLAADLATIDTEVGLMQVDVTAIKTKTDIFPQILQPRFQVYRQMLMLSKLL